MGNIRRGVRKGIVLALSAAMTLGLTSTFMGESNEVKAADKVPGEPSYFYSKDDLLAGDASGKMRLYYGTSYNGNYQSWYVYGKDSGVSGDNTVLWSVTPFGVSNIDHNEYQFSSLATNDTSKTYQTGDGDYTDGSVTVGTSIYPAHYGSSDIRHTLQTLAASTSRFSTVEQSYLNATTVKNYDIKNGNVVYTTTDKLYLPAAYNCSELDASISAGKDEKHVYLGSQEDKVYSLSTSDSTYWTRSSHGSGTVNYYWPTVVSSSAYLTNYHTTDLLALRPATNLKLEDALFAVPVETTANSGRNTVQKITSETPSARIRRDANDAGKGLGTVSYNSASESLDLSHPGKATHFVIYGTLKTGETGYIRTLISQSSNTYAQAAIKQFDFTKPIKVWLELTEASSNICYATNPDDTVDTAVDYNITEGAGSTWTKDSGKTLTFKADGKPDEFTEVRVDGTTIDAANYDQEDGSTKAVSTIVTLKADYLNTLSEGEHSLAIYWKDGKASTTFTVAAASVNPNPGENPGGDNQNPGGDNQNPGGDNTGNNGNGGGDNSADNGNSGNTGNTGANTGANGTTTGSNTWDKNGNTDLVIKPDASIKDVTEVSVDGKVLDPKNYTIAADGTVTISKDYLKNLTNGNHTVKISGKGANGESLSSSTTVSVKNSNALAPKTGETFLPYLWLASVALMLSVLASIVYDIVKAGRKRRA